MARTRALEGCGEVEIRRLKGLKNLRRIVTSGERWINEEKRTS